LNLLTFVHQTNASKQNGFHGFQVYLAAAILHRCPLHQAARWRKTLLIPLQALPERTPMPQTAIRPATTSADLAAVRQLCWDFHAFLRGVSDVDADMTDTFYPVPKYTDLMDRLDTIHARPQGIILLAELDGAPVGCGMSHALDPATSEVKRLYVKPQARGHGLARKLVSALVAQAADDGFNRVVLDTSISLTAARALYASLGFVARGPYQETPASALPHLLFFEKALSSDAAS
jgi:GNAT superfamily N-acetyltransferase